MHSLLDSSVPSGYGCFGVDFHSLFQVTQNLAKRCIDKECICIWCNVQECSITGYRYIAPGSELKDHPSYGRCLYLNCPYLILN